MYGILAYETKEEVMEWMLDIQLGRRNLSPIQRIAIAEKYRSIYEKQARANQLSGLKQNQNTVSQNSSKRTDPIDVRAKLAETAGVSTDTYSKGKKILESNNEEVKNAVLSGEMSINAGYNKIREKNNVNAEDSNVTTSSTLPQIQKAQPIKSQVSEEVRQICEDLKTERSKEYLDSIWNYKIDIIECMNAGFEKVKEIIQMRIRFLKTLLKQIFVNVVT